MEETGSQKLRIVYMGTPGFAAVVLESLLKWEGCDVVAAYTQPDRPCGRGRVCKPPEVKQLALEHGLPVHQPLNFKQPEDVQQLADLQPDVLVVAAYGLILPKKVLDIPTHGAMNVHASLLPKYRGAAPIQRAILDGEPFSGITIMQMDVGMDTGDMLIQRALAIGIQDTAADLHDQLAAMGGNLIVQALEKLKAGRLKAMPQDNDLATYAPKLEKSDGEIHWDRTAEDIHNRIRAMFPWPGAYFAWDGLKKDKPVRLSLVPGRIGDELSDDDKQLEPGTFLDTKDIDGTLYLTITTADRYYHVPSVTPEGKKSMNAEAFACGYLSRCPAPADLLGS